MGIFFDWIRNHLSESEKRPDYTFDKFVKNAEELERDVRAIEDDAEKKEKDLDKKKTDLEKSKPPVEESPKKDDGENEDSWKKIRQIALDRKSGESKKSSKENSSDGRSGDSSD